MNYYMNNRNIVPSGGGRGFGGRIFGGVADAMRMLTGAEISDRLHESKTNRELEADKERELHRTGEHAKREKISGSQDRLTEGKKAREARRNLQHRADTDLNHFINLTAATRTPEQNANSNLPKIDPNVVLSGPGGSAFQAGGLKNRTPKPDQQG